MRRSNEGEPKFALAEKVEVSEDRLHYTFYLRPAYWEDGEPVKASDFEQTWKTLLSPDFPCPFAHDLFIIQGAKEAKKGELSLDQISIRSLDQRTLQVSLVRPIPYFLDLITTRSFFPFPQHLAPSYSTNGPFIGNGPYRLKEWKRQNELLLVKSPTYWDHASVKLEEIHLYQISDEMTELQLFEAKQLDWAGAPLTHLPLDALSELKKKQQLTTYPMACIYHYVLNTQVPPFHNVHFRKALSYAIQRNAIVEHVTACDELPATSFVPYGLSPLSGPLFEDGNREKAHYHLQIALQEMGMTLEELPPIQLSFNTQAAHHKIAQAVQQQWIETLGIRVELHNLDWKVFLDTLGQKKFQIARMGLVATFQDPAALLDFYRYEDSPNNYVGWSNPLFSAKMEAAEQEVDPQTRLNILREAESILIEEMPIIPIYFYTGSYVKDPHVKNVEISQLAEASYKSAYLEW